METIEATRLLVAAEVCQMLRISRSTLTRMIANGDLPVIRLGRHGRNLRIDAAVVQRLIDEDWRS